MSKIIDYATNLATADDPARYRLSMRLNKQFGYLPVYGCTISDMTYAMSLYDHIIKAYPGYRWVIEYRDSIISVVNESLAPDWGFKLKYKMMDNDGLVIKRFAGALLERYNLSAGPRNDDELNEKPRDLRGNILRTA